VDHVSRLRLALIAGVAVVAVLAVVALAGCGGGSGGGSSGTSAGAYVKARCLTLTAWKTAVQKAGVKIQAERPKTLADGKRSYVGFVGTLLSATRHAAAAMRAAGSPSIPGGRDVAQRLVSAFIGAGTALQQAATAAGAIPTNHTSAYAKAVGALTTSISHTLSTMGSVSPGSSPQLQAAAAKEPACKALVG
jgi:hypothetical protein